MYKTRHFCFHEAISFLGTTQTGDDQVEFDGPKKLLFQYFREVFFYVFVDLTIFDFVYVGSALFVLIVCLISLVSFMIIDLVKLRNSLRWNRRCLRIPTSVCRGSIVTYCQKGCEHKSSVSVQVLFGQSRLS